MYIQIYKDSTTGKHQTQTSTLSNDDTANNNEQPLFKIT